MGSYKNWEDQADKYMVKVYGVGIDDIPDMPWHDWFTDGWTIQEATDRAIERVNSGEFL